MATYTFENVTTDHTISVTFTGEVLIIVASAGSGGSISPSGNVQVNYGEDQLFTITPDTGYEVLDIFVDGASV